MANKWNTRTAYGNSGIAIPELGREIQVKVADDRKIYHAKVTKVHPGKTFFVNGEEVDLDDFMCVRKSIYYKDPFGGREERGSGIDAWRYI